MTENKIIAKIAEIVSLQDQINTKANNPFVNIYTVNRLTIEWNRLISEIETEYKYFDHPIIRAYKDMILALRFDLKEYESFDCETLFDFCVRNLKENLKLFHYANHAN